MIIVFADDSTVTVLPDVAAVRAHCEAIDVEDGVYHFFDEFGRRLLPRMTAPVRRTSLPFGIKLVSEGYFELESDANGDLEPFDSLLANAAPIEPNQWFATIDDLARHVADNRAGN